MKHVPHGAEAIKPPSERHADLWDGAGFLDRMLS